MKHNRYLLLMLALLVSLGIRAQFDPQNPDEPGAQYWQLTLKTIPGNAGYFSLPAESYHADKEQLNIEAYNHSDFKFVQWEDETGKVLTKDQRLSYTMPARRTTLVARYEYSPQNPEEPEQSTVRRHLYLKTVPEGAGWFNFGGDNDINVGEVVHIWAYSSENYVFRNWTQDGTVISTASDFVYTMPDKNVTLTANYDYDFQPVSPDEPGQPQGERNNLYSMREGVLAGQTFIYPIYLENTGGNVTGFSLDISFPQGVTVDADAITLTERAPGHTLQVEQSQSGTWHITVSGASIINGAGGKVLLIPIHIPATALVGDIYAVELDHGIVYKTDGQQTDINVRGGSLKIMRSPDERPDSPDYVVANVQTTSSVIGPGETIHLTWEVKNQGNIQGYGEWTERIYLVDTNGRKVCIGTSQYAATELLSGSTVSRSADVTLSQLPGIDGKADLAVTVVPAISSGEIADYQTNNSSQTTGMPIEVGKRLYLMLPDTPQQEGQVKSVRCQLSRSGSWSNSETFQLTKLLGDDRISVPAVVNIPREQAAAYFYIPLADNKTCDTDSIVSLRVEGNGYEAVEGSFIVRDDELPALRLTASVSEVNEGDSFELTVSLAQALSTDLTVNIACDNPLRFNYPTTIKLPAGQTSASVTLTAINDSEPSNLETIEFFASAEGFDKSSVLIMLHDDDVPEIDLVLTPSIVREDAGVNAVYATLKRTKVTNNKVTVRLTDNSEGHLFYPSTVVLEKGVTEKTVTIGVVDNDLVDGENIINITAEVYLSSCDCGVVGTKQGVVTRQLHILDNDGPTLSLSSSLSVIREGDENGTQLTVTRNTPGSEPLIVLLQSESQGIAMPTQVTIPAGERSTSFAVRARANSEQEGSRVVTIRANANGYNSGTVWLSVTDMTLPDMAVKSVVISPDDILASDDYTIDITFMNVGIIDVPARSTYFTEVAGESLTMTIADAIAPTEEVTVTLKKKAPAVPGNYTINVECNKARLFEEIQEYNNYMTTTLTVKPLYTYSVTTDRTNYQIGETVKINGTVKARKGNAAGIAVEPYIVSYGQRQVMTATTDAEGRFAAEFTLPAGMGGDFAVGACTPGENATDALTTIHVYGMARTTATYIKNYMYAGEPYVVRVPIKNLSSLPLHNIKASVANNAGHYELTGKDVTLLEGYAETEVELTLQSDEVTTTNNWERVWVKLTSDDGATMSFVLYCYTNKQEATLVFDQPVIRANITKSKPTTIPVVLTNTGGGETGRITVEVPTNQNFITLTTPREIPSLANGDSTIIVLQFNPANLDVNIVQKGSIAVNCENADGQIISYNLKVVGEDKGNLLVSVEDENTIYGNAEGQHPLVADATVELRDYNTGLVLHSGTTSTDGQVYFNEVPEGYYTLFVTAPKHDSYMQNVLVSPGETTEHLATISYQAISISYRVEETTVEDKYKIVSEMTYETQVPVPVVVLDTPDELNLYDVEMGHELLYYIKVENRGLITAQNVCVSLPSQDGFLFTPLSEYAGFDLAAKQSVTIPVLVTYAPNGAQSRARRAGGEKKPKCHDYTWANWEWVCKANRTGTIGKIGKFLMRACDPDEPTPKDPKPDNRKVIEPKYPDRPDVEPQLRYWTAEQPDLELLKEIVSTIACALACFFPDIPDLPELPHFITTEDDLLDWLHEQIPEDLEIPVCILEELLIRHNNVRSINHRAADNSLRNTYLNRLELYMDFVNNQRNYYKELLNAPMLFNDNATVNMLTTDLNTIIKWMSKWHSEGNLYDKSVSDITQEALAIMPQHGADWYDFNLQTFIERMMNTWRQRDGIAIYGDNVCNITTLDTCQTNIASCYQQIVELGYLNIYDMLKSMKADLQEINNGSKNVCATVKIQIKQELAFTRQAFRGTLTIENSTENALTDITALIQASSEDGTLATNREMQINLENFEGFTEQDNGSYRLEAGQSGTFTFIFIPTKFAATDHDVVYSFGGALTFNNGEGIMIRELYPVSLIVRPSPELDLSYFMQRDVYGDDPLTEEVEPIIPAEFALLINNKGYGDASNVRMVTQQPKIVENEKGLLIDFKLISSQVNGQPATLSFGEEIVNDFGTIPARSQAYAQWWLTSTLMGHFINYDVTATHVTSYGNEALSLLGDVTIHELIHGFTPPGKTDNFNVVRAFLVNDTPDSEDTPDEVYFTDGTQKGVNRVSGAVISRQGDSQYQLTINTSGTGWFYGSLPDPTNGQQQLTNIIRQRDGRTLPIDNAWQTAVTMRDGKDPVHERRLHFVCETMGANETWLLNFEEQDIVKVEDVKGVADHERLLLSPMPLSSWMYLSGNFREVRMVEVYNMRGIRQIQAINLQSGQGIYVGNLRPGIYHVRAMTDNGVYTTKVLKR